MHAYARTWLQGCTSKVLIYDTTFASPYKACVKSSE